MLWDKLPDNTCVYPWSAYSARKKWEYCLTFLGITKEFRFTPGCLRAGGAVHAFRGTSIESLMWRMRITSHATLAHYLQEVVARTSLKRLPEDSKARIRLFASFYKVAIGAGKAMF